ncbi:hypothetical protein C451_13034 [Halococcus thailandensis JCM 13552]|uniref:Uncharacterized protein n=1 Tax=Halococcus thailandensis JCM 13552 TaxID=1227457 RepID=M0N485_9EURY|nr:hypothetical protein C451_13034 [Halococcus thailandensis JCM 13552]
MDGLVDLAAVEGVLALAERILGSEMVLDDARLLVVLAAVEVEHVRDALVGVAGDRWLLAEFVQIPLERARRAEVGRDRCTVLLAERFERVGVA